MMAAMVFLMISSGDPFVKVLTYLIIILIAAKLGAELFERMKQPAVLGELIAGVILGNLILVNDGWNFFEPLRAAVISDRAAIGIDILAKIGILLLLFEVGLESSLKDMKRVGISSFLVAVIGVVFPFIFGYFVSALFISKVPEEILAVSPNFSVRNIHMFVGATLCATSVGITARVFKDMSRIQIPEARIVLGAAVIDDVLGLIILATVSAVVSSAETGSDLSFLSLVKLSLIAVGFLVGALIVGTYFMPRVIKVAAKFRTQGLMLITAILFCFALSALSSEAGLASIVGAFAAGLILEEIHFREFGANVGIGTLIQPITVMFVPIFFVVMGIQVHLESFLDPSVLGISGALIAAAIIGKQACGFVVREKNVDRLTVGLGMIPRGEVGLIFASLGKELGVINNEIFSAIVVMVVLTTFVTPPLLKWSIAKAEGKRAAYQTEEGDT
jgi:Kef-type K+ transport system membrane component KefB